MKRTYISPEFTYTKVDGTFNMLEERTFFGSKMLEIEDTITVDNSDIIYYQKNNHEQINLTSEKLLPPIIYSGTSDKRTHHILEIDQSQTDFERINNAKWILTINTRELLRNYVFAQLKSSRVFEGVLSSKTKDNNIDQSIFSYIDNNVTDIYTFSKITLYLKYNSLLESGNYQSIDLPLELLSNNKSNDCSSTITWPGGEEIDPDFLDENGNVWENFINTPSNIEDKLQSDITFDQKKLVVKFRQGEKRSDFNFSYYFDIIYTKI